MNPRWWQAWPSGRQPIPDVFDPVDSAAFRERCWAGAVLVAEAGAGPTRVFLDPVVQAARRNWRAALAAALQGRDFPVALHLLCVADWHRCLVDTPAQLLAATAAWTGLSDGGAWATVRIACHAGAEPAPKHGSPILARIGHGITPLASGRYRSAAALLLAARRQLDAREAMLARPPGPGRRDGGVAALDHHLLDGADPPRIRLAEVADWIVEAARTRTAIVAYDALTGPESAALQVVVPTSTADPAGAAAPAVAVLRISAGSLRPQAAAAGD